MKHLILLAGVVASASLPSLAQPNIVGGPIQLRNPHRRGDKAVPDNANATSISPNDGSLGGALMNSAPVAAPAVAMAVDGPYLFVLRGDFLFQFDKATLKLINSVELPRIVIPSPTPAPAEDKVRTHASPPFRPRPHFKPDSAS